jgi:hypothetical protein
MAVNFDGEMCLDHKTRINLSTLPRDQVPSVVAVAHQRISSVLPPAVE